MEGCCTVAISSDLSFLFPTLLQLSTEGEGFGSSFPGGHFRAVRSQELQRLGCGWGGRVGQEWGLLQEPLLRVSLGLGDSVAARTHGSWCWLGVS